MKKGEIEKEEEENKKAGEGECERVGQSPPSVLLLIVRCASGENS